MVTVMSTMPATSVGEVAVQVVVEEQLTAVAAFVPNAAVVAPGTKPVPVTVTTVPATSGPTFGLREVTAGTTS